MIGAFYLGQGYLGQGSAYTATPPSIEMLNLFMGIEDEPVEVADYDESILLGIEEDSINLKDEQLR